MFESFIPLSSYFDPCFARALYSSMGSNMIHLINLLVPWSCCQSITKITRNGLNGAMFVTISPFLVIDGNTIKYKFIKIHKLNHIHLLGCLPPSNVGLASPNSMIPSFLLLIFATSPLYVDLIHLTFLPLWKTFLPDWKILALIHISPPLESNHLKRSCKAI